MENILSKFLTIPKEGCNHFPMEAGKKVRLIPMVEQALVDYYTLNKYNKHANKKWLKMGQILSGSENGKWFSLLHIADERSAYPIGTAIIEIDCNEDIEIRGDAISVHFSISVQTSSLPN